MFPFEKNDRPSQQGSEGNDKMCSDGQIFGRRETKQSSQRDWFNMSIKSLFKGFEYIGPNGGQPWTCPEHV